MKKIIYSLAVASLLFVSCKKEAEAEAVSTEATIDTTAVATDATATPIAPVVANAAGTNTNTIMNQTPSTTTMTQTVTPQMLNQQAVQPVKVAAGMNPSHGQPGHRCDIAVGAPLNSAPGKAAITQKPQIQPSTVTTSSTPQFTTDGKSVITTTSNTAPSVVTDPGMNPPHGQAGHDCAVAVGAPLPTK